MGILDAPALTRRDAYVLSSDPALQTFQAAVANRDSANVNMLFIGDSVTEGTGATTILTRWQARLQAMVRARFPISGVVGVANPHLPGLKTSSVAYTYPITQAGTARLGGSGNAVTYGLGRRTDPLTATSMSDTFTFTGTSLDVFYADATDGGVMSITIDGGTPTLVDTRNASPVGSGLIWSSAALTPGSHTVVIGYDATSVASSTVNFEGVYLYNGDEAKGFKFFDAGHHGYTSSTYVTGASWQRSLRTTKADIVVIELGANDFTNAITAATFQANLVTLVAAVRTQLAAVQTIMPTIVLMMLWERSTGGASGFTATEAWANYVTAAKAVAAGDSKMTVLDLGKRFPSPVAYPNPSSDAANLGLFGDTVHLSDKGHARLADEMFRFLFSGSAPSGDAALVRAGSAVRTPAKTGYVSAGVIAGTSNALGNGNLRLAPVDLPDCGVTSIGVDVTAAGSTGCTLRLCVYADDGTGGAPGALLSESSVAADAIATPEAALNLSLRGGRYWIGGALQGAPASQPTVRTFTNPLFMVPYATAAQAAQNNGFGWAQSGVTGSAPGTVSGLVNSSVMPRVVIKVRV